MNVRESISKLAGRLNGRSKSSGGGKRARLRRLLIEQMEDRRLLAVIDLATFTTSQGVLVTGADAADQSGWSVSGAGDVNGDGFDDFIVGAPRAGASMHSRPLAGETYLIFGGAIAGTIDLATLGTPGGAAGFTLLGANAGDRSGYMVSGGGDVNGDGFDDLLIGAGKASRIGSSGWRYDIGESYVVFGGNALPATIDLATLGTPGGSAGVTFLGVDAFDNSGLSVSLAGDVNGDGFDDVLIGAYGGDGGATSRSDSGESYLVFGGTSLPATINLSSLSNPSSTLGLSIFGSTSRDYSGFSVSSAGDVNGDGFDDLLIGAFQADGVGNSRPSAGESYVIFGGKSLSTSIDLALLGAPGGSVGITIVGSESGDRSGFSVSSAGDINGDGFDDILLGATDADGVGNSSDDAGESYIVFGGPALPATIDLALLGMPGGTAGVTLYGVDADDISSYTVSDAGDVNADGYDDFLIGAFAADGQGNSMPTAGETYLVFGGPALSMTIELASLGTPGGAPGITIFGAESQSKSAYSVRGAGDINGDGFDDILVGAPGAASTGTSYVIYGGDFSATITHLGTNLGDVLTGSAAADTMIGGQGDDLLIGGGGADVLTGGQGDDILVVSDLNFNRIVGGNGNDTLRIDGSGLALDLRLLADNRLIDIEQIDITGQGDNTLTLNQREVLNLSGDSNSLVVHGNLGDQLWLDYDWLPGADEIINARSYRVLVKGAATLKVETDVALVYYGEATPTDIQLSVSSVAENQPFYAAVGQFSSLDLNAGDTFEYSLVEGNGDIDNSSFEIEGDELLTAEIFDFESYSSYTIRVRTTDLSGLWFEKIFTISITDIPESQPPVIGAFDTTVNYTENAAPILLDNNATLTDVDSLDFNDGVMTVSLIDNAEASDRLEIRNVGTGAGQIGVAGNQITYAGNPIATYAGGVTGDVPLVVTFGSGGTRVAAQALLRNITFRNLSETPSPLPRIVEVVLTDGDGGESLPVTKTIDVTPVNDAPVVADFSGLASYTEGDVPALLATGATVADVDSSDFNSGRLTVRVLTNSQTTDRLGIRHEGLAPGDIGISGTDVLYGNIVVGSFTGTTTLIVTLNANANAAAVQAILRNTTFHSVSTAPSPVTRTISVVLIDGDGGTSATVTTSLNVVALNSAPIVGAFDTTVTYAENAVPLLIDNNATVSDPDSLDFDGGVLSATLTANSENDDRLAVRNQGTAANQIGVVANQISFGGLLIGFVYGGTSGSDPLQIAFNAAATPAAVQAVLRNITFNSVSDSPSTLPRIVEVQLTDGDGGASIPVIKFINVTAVNDPPVVSDFSGLSSYTEDEQAVDLAINAIVDDLDSTDFDLGRLIARVAVNSQTTDRISIRHAGVSAGGIGVSGASVSYSGIEIGTFAGTTTLTVTLNAAASLEAVQALLRNLTFSSISGNPSTLQRTISVTLSDGDGGTSLAVTTLVDVIAVNDAPIIGAFTPDISYVENAVALLLDSNATVTDVDSADFADGVLTVSLTANGHVDDRLSIRNQGAGANQIGVDGNQVTYGGLVIGTFTGGNTEPEQLQITFNLDASRVAVQALLRNVAFSNVSDAPSTLPRTVEVVLTDGDGGSSGPVTKIINVTAVNDAPIIGGFAGNVGYTVGGPAAVLAPDATVDDVDNTSFDLGVLTVRLTSNRQSTDRIEILSVGTGLGQISISGNQVLYEGVIFGTFSGTTTLAVTFNANASRAAVQSLLRSITFRSLSATPTTLSRTVTVTLSDGVGGTSALQSKLIDIL